MIHWDEGFCELLAERGYRVIRFDNRDIGRSTKIDSARRADDRGRCCSGRRARPTRSPTWRPTPSGLLDHLEIDRRPRGRRLDGRDDRPDARRSSTRERVLSLCSIMSTTGNRRLGCPGCAPSASLMRGRRASREAYIEHAVKTFKVIGSPAYPMDEPRFRELVGARLRPRLPPGGRRPPAARDHVPRATAPRTAPAASCRRWSSTAPATRWCARRRAGRRRGRSPARGCG